MSAVFVARSVRTAVRWFADWRVRTCACDVSVWLDRCERAIPLPERELAV